MPLDFPNSPTVGDSYTANGIVWSWDGEKWVSLLIDTSGPYLPLTGGTISGSLTVIGSLDGLVTAANSVTPRWLTNRFADVRNVLDFGVIMDGTTDNLAAFDAARASALVNGTVTVPRGSTKYPNGITGGIGAPILWMLDGTTFPGGTTAINTLGKAGDLVETYFNGYKYFGRRQTLKDSGPAVRVDMIITDATGGSVDNVAGGLQITAQQNLGNTNSLWGLTSVVDGYGAVDSGGVVGIQSTVRKHAGSFAWAIQSVTLDDTGLASSGNGHGFVGAEIAVRANNLDDALNAESFGGVGTRNAIHLTLNRSNASLDNDSSFAHAIWISGDADATRSYVGSVYAVGTSMKTFSVLDARGAGAPFGYTDPIAAVRMSTGQIVDFSGGASLNSNAGKYLQYTTSGTARLRYMAGATEAMSISDTGNGIFNGSLTASNAQTVKMQMIGGATGFLQSVGGRLVVQSPSTFSTTITPVGFAGANDLVVIQQRLDINPFILGTPAMSAGHHQGVRINVQDSIVSTDGVWHFNVSSNVGALPWTTGEVLASTGNRRNSFGNIYTNSNTGTCGPTAPTGTGTVSDGTVTWVYVGSDFVSNRVGSNSNMSVRSQTGPGTPLDQFQWIATAGTFTGSANQGGTDPAVASLTRGTGYGVGSQAWLFAGATNWHAIVGGEYDAGIFNGGNRAVASAFWRYGLIVASYGEDQSVSEDSAIFFGSRGVPWRTPLQFGEAALQVGTFQTNAILSYLPRPPGSIGVGVPYYNPRAVNGVDLHNIKFTTSAVRGPSNSGIDANGGLFSGALSIITTQTAVEIDAPGYVTNGVTWAAGNGFAADDEIYDPDGTGLIARVLTVNGSGQPLTLTDDPANGGRRGSTLVAPPANPRPMWGGAGATIGTPGTLNVTAWTRVGVINIGSTSATAVNIGRAAITTSVAGKVKTAALLTNAANDAAAAGAGVGLNEFYRNGSIVMQRVA